MKTENTGHVGKCLSPILSKAFKKIIIVVITGQGDLTLLTCVHLLIANRFCFWNN